MSIRKTVKYIFILITVLNAKAQTDSTWERGLRIGFDASRLVVTVFSPERKAYEMSFDTEIKPRLYAVLEGGMETVNQENDNMKYHSNGFYGRMGIDYNILKRDDPKSRDMVFFGFRYAFGSLTQKTDSYVITEPRYGDINGSFETANLNCHWIEGAFGCKVEVVRNFFMGICMRERILLFSKSNLTYPNAWPGFGDGSKKSMFALNYSLYYQIPLMKVKILAKAKTKR
jgi:hypothetical protein